MLELIIFPILFGVITAMIASKKGYDGFLWWLYGTLLFLVALPHALLLDPKPEALQDRARAAGLKRCPHCAEMIQPAAKVCRYCGRDVFTDAPPPPSQVRDPRFPYACTLCGTGLTGDGDDTKVLLGKPYCARCFSAELAR